MKLGSAQNSMIKSGILTVYVSDLSRAVEFYTGTLGLSLKMHVPGHWFQVELEGLSIGLHPASPKSPRPGHAESLMIGFTVGHVKEMMPRFWGLALWAV